MFMFWFLYEYISNKSINETITSLALNEFWRHLISRQKWHNHCILIVRSWQRNKTNSKSIGHDKSFFVPELNWHQKFSKSVSVKSVAVIVSAQDSSQDRNWSSVRQSFTTFCTTCLSRKRRIIFISARKIVMKCSLSFLLGKSP